MRSAIVRLKNFLARLNAKAIEPTAQAIDFDDGYSWIPNWPNIFQGQTDEWQSYVEKAKHGPKVLIATCTGGNSAMTPIESLLAVALTMRGANVEIILCDKALPACPNMITIAEGDQEKFIANGPDKCDWCFEAGSRVFKDLGLKVHMMSDWIKDEDRIEAERIAQEFNTENVSSFIDQDVMVGHHAMTGALRYFGRGDFEGEPNALPILRRFLKAGIIANRALNRLFTERGYKHTVLNQGVYVPQGVVVGVAKKFKSTVAPFELGYRDRSIILDNWTAQFEEQNSIWESLPWSETMENDIMSYLDSRRKVTLDWMKVQSADGSQDVNQISKEIGLDPNKPTIALLTNVVWDAQVFYPTGGFSSMLEWLRLTVEYFAQRPDLQLLIRIHPGELQGFVKSRQLVQDEMKKMFPNLPNNIFVIPPESPINTYAALEHANAVLIYATTAAIEFASLGYPVIIAGEAFLRNKGIGYDVVTKNGYFELLDKLPMEKISGDRLIRARKYAYHFFLRRMVPLNVLETQRATGNVPYTIRELGLEAFARGGDTGLDVICDGVLNGALFIYPTERVQKELQEATEAPQFFTVGTVKH